MVDHLTASRLSPMSQTVALPRSLELPGGGRLPRPGSVDAVSLEGRAAELAKRSIKRESKIFALDLAIRMIDLTTLEGADTPGKVRALSAKAVRPDPGDASIPSVAVLVSEGVEAEPCPRRKRPLLSLHANVVAVHGSEAPNSRTPFSDT